MFARKYAYYYCYAIIVVAIVICGYLLHYHFAVISGILPEIDLCSEIFGKGCMVATMSSYSVSLGIPMAGWGLIYLIILLSLILTSHALITEKSDEMIQIAFWISFLGAFVSVYFVVVMIISPVLFCPYCTVFHLLNLMLPFVIKNIKKSTFKQLTKGFYNSLAFIFLGKTISILKWKWLALILPIVLGLSVYQWITIKYQDIKIDLLSGYSPLKDIENFESSKLFEFRSSENDPVLGSDDANVSLVVFSDFQCSLCKMFASNFKNLVKKNHQLTIRFKYFPLNSECNHSLKSNLHPMSCKIAWACESARLQGKFWEYHDSIFSYGEITNEQQLFEIAKSVNLDMKKFDSDFSSEICRKKVNLDINEGIRLKIDGTPTAFLNGKKLTNLSEDNINFLIKFLSK